MQILFGHSDVMPGLPERDLSCHLATHLSMMGQSEAVPAGRSSQSFQRLRRCDGRE